MVGSLSRWLFGFFLSTGGLAVLAALDSSVLFSLPFAIDAALVFMVAQNRDLFWLYPLIVIPPSLAGAALTYWIGKKLGEDGLERFVSARRLDAIRHRVRESGAFALASTALLPPPFPFTAVILVSGALEVEPRRFFSTVAGVRLVRFGGEAILAMFYGHVILTWLKSDTVRLIGGLAFLLLLAGAAVSGYRLVRASAPRGANRAVKA